MWRAALFRGLIEGSATKGISKVNKDAAVVWLKERFTVEPEFSDAEKRLFGTTCWSWLTAAP